MLNDGKDHNKESKLRVRSRLKHIKRMILGSDYNEKELSSFKIY
jgi:hypothetical protein